MIISRTPLRMSFVGGGSDIPDFYQHERGAVISTAINKYIYVTVNKKFDDGIRVAYSRNEEVNTVDQLEHKLVQAVMRRLNLDGGVEITTVADIPSRGTGLGSSSSFTVGLVHALSAYLGKRKSASDLAEESCHVEIHLCGEPIGKQDQYAASYGGFNKYEFLSDGQVKVSPVILCQETVETFHSNLVLFYTGITRSASALLSQQSQEVRKNQDKRVVLRKMVALCDDFETALVHGDVDMVGEILHQNWELKKSLSDGISNLKIDEWYGRARKAGALGGKLLGAGAGGFLLFYAPKQRHERIAQELKELRPVPFDFDPFGSQIIFFNPTK